MIVRDYRDADADALMRLFHATVHTICRADYTPAELEAWAPASGQDLTSWSERFATTRPFVAVEGAEPVGFLELLPDGHIDCCYVHHHHQRRGVAAALLDRALAESHRRRIVRLDAEVSITAVPFFSRRGFVMVREQLIDRNGQRLRNVVMERAVEMEGAE